MENNEDEDIKVIKYDNNEEEDQKNNNKSDRKTEAQNDNEDNSKKKKPSKLRAQRTKAPKVFLKEQKKDKKGFSLFSCCLPSNKDDDEDD